MDHCQRCRARGAVRCAAIWRLDQPLVDALRQCDALVRGDHRSEILIADVLIGLCHLEASSAQLRRLGIDPVALSSEIQRQSFEQSRQHRNTPIALSEVLNALLVACEESAALIGAPVVSIEIFAATLVSNAAHDVAAQIFASHARALQQRTRQAHAGDRRPTQSRTYVRPGESHAGSARQSTHETTTITERGSERAYAQAYGRQMHNAYALEHRAVASRQTDRALSRDRVNRGALGRDGYDQIVRLLTEQGQRLDRLEQRWTKSSKRLRVKKLIRNRQSTKTKHSSRSDSSWDGWSSRQRSDWDKRTESGCADTRTKRDRTVRSERVTHSTSRNENNAHSEIRFYLSLDDDLVDAPSIGPKTAARFEPLGVITVRDLLTLDVEDTAAKLNVRHITASVLKDWQDQARLVCTVPWLRGTHAQLLVGAEYRSAEDIATADLGEVLAGILRFAATNQGERVLRTNAPPEREKVAAWLGYAKQADMSRVA